MDFLNTHTVTTNFNSMSSSMVSGPNFQINVPSSSVMMAKPLSYRFRVAEYEKDGEIVKVGLQVQEWEHDNFGAPTLKSDWKDVERVRLPLEST